MGERPKVLVTRTVPQRVIDELRASCDVDVYESEWVIPRDELLTRVRGKDAAITLLTERVDAEFLDAAGPGLKIVANYAVGFDNIDVPECTKRGVLVSNTPDVLTETTADVAWALMLAAARRVAEGDRFLRSKTPWIWGPLMMLGQDAHGKTLGVVGFGRIGRAVGRRAAGFGMRLVYHSLHRADPGVEKELSAGYRSLDDLLAEADLVSINCKLTEETRHLFGEEQFRKMKPTAVLVNTARGPVVDEAALAQALQAGEIFAAGIDVFEEEPEVHPALLACENAVIIPHLGSSTVDTREAMGMLAAENTLAVLAGTDPPTLVNRDLWDSARSR